MQRIRTAVPASRPRAPARALAALAMAARAMTTALAMSARAIAALAMSARAMTAAALAMSARAMTTAALATCALTGSGCGSTEPPAPPLGASSAPSGTAVGTTGTSRRDALTAATAITTATAEPEPAAARPPAVSYTEAVDIVFPGGLPAEAAKCKPAAEGGSGDGAAPGAGNGTTAGAGNGAAAAPSAAEDAIRCLLNTRFSGDAAARDLAIGLYDKVGTVTGVIREHTMDGGWRGELHLVPELPVGQHRRHLQWVKASFEDIDALFAGLDARRPPGTRSTYRYRALAFRFFRSVGRTTPSAYADGWEVSYNVSGSLHANAGAVRETMFHEVFHSNDQAHRRWSERVLTPIVDGILTKCGQKTACLTPYAPGTTMVRGGTYYAFQKGNGVWEYAAELATRYFQEHRAILAGEKPKKPPFKCGPPENGKAWTALVDELFGVDLTSECD